MISLPFSRLTFLGLALLLPGLYFGIRFSSGFLRVLSRKFRRGKPYLKGSATDYFSYAAVCLVAAALGAILTLAAAIQGGFQETGELREVGMMSIESPVKGRIELSLSLEKGHPGPRDLQVNLAGERWALEGEFLRWRWGPGWLGFRQGHRITVVLGSETASGSPGREADSRSRVVGSYALGVAARRLTRGAPLFELTTRRTPWMPAAAGQYRILAGSGGYVLVEERDEDRSAGFPSQDPAIPSPLRRVRRRI